MSWKQVLKYPGNYIVVSVLGYALYGVYLNDLYIPSFRFSSDDIHLRGAAGIMMACAIGSGSLFVLFRNFEHDEVIQPQRFVEALKYLAILLAILAFSWGVILQHNKSDEKDYGGKDIARYIMGGVSDLHLKSVSYSPERANFQYWVTVKLDKYKSSDEVRKLSASIAERVCKVESALKIKLVTRNINVVVTQGNYWLLNRTINLSECISSNN